MKRLAGVWVLLVCCCSCTGTVLLPDLQPSAADPAITRRCQSIFPTGRWQFVHRITFENAEGKGEVIGVLVLDGQEIRCALMTVEGLTLFEAKADQDKAPQVSRAIAPFDTKDFAFGLLRDVRTIFQIPEGDLGQGIAKGAQPVCRYTQAERVTDIAVAADGCWTMARYIDRKHIQTITATSCTTTEPMILPNDIELVSAGPAGYSLRMHLLSAEKLPTAF